MIAMFIVLFAGTLYILNLNKGIIFEKNLHYEDNSFLNIYELTKSAVYKETSELNIDECGFEVITLNRSSDSQNIVSLYSTCERNQKFIMASAQNNNIRVLAIKNKTQSFSFISNKEFYTCIKDLELMKLIMSEVDRYDLIQIEVNPIKDIINNIPDNQLDIKKLPGKENIGEAKFVLVVKVEYVGADDYDLLYYFK